MQIIPYILQNPLLKQINKKRDLSATPYMTITPLNSINNSNIKPLEKDTITFGRIAKNATPLRKLMRYQIPDLYSDRIVINPALLEKFANQKLFNQNIQIIVKTLLPYEKSLFDIEKQFFNIIKNYAKKMPNLTLTDLIKYIAPEHNQLLLDQQLPIFNKLNKLSENLPEIKLQQYQSLMLNINKKLKKEPVVQEFSSSELQYKLKKLRDEAKQKHLIKDIRTLDQLIAIAKKIPENKPQNKTQNKKTNGNSKNKNNKYSVQTQKNIYGKLIQAWKSSNLCNNEELIKIFKITEAEINQKSISIPFTRKSFIHDLKKIINTVNNKDLVLEMIHTAKQLPTSQENLSAFVMKCCEFSPYKIGYSMLINSIGNIDHIIAHKNKGPDAIPNYAITSSKKNTEKADIPFDKYLKKNPEIRIFAQKQIDRFIELYNNGNTFANVGLDKDYIINLANIINSYSNSSSKNNTMIINTDKLK